MNKKIERKLKELKTNVDIYDDKYEYFNIFKDVLETLPYKTSEYIIDNCLVIFIKSGTAGMRFRKEVTHNRDLLIFKDEEGFSCQHKYFVAFHEISHSLFKHIPGMVYNKNHKLVCNRTKIIEKCANEYAYKWMKKKFKKIDVGDLITQSGFKYIIWRIKKYFKRLNE